MCLTQQPRQLRSILRKQSVGQGPLVAGGPPACCHGALAGPRLPFPLGAGYGPAAGAWPSQTSRGGLRVLVPAVRHAFPHCPLRSVAAGALGCPLSPRPTPQARAGHLGVCACCLPVSASEGCLPTSLQLGVCNLCHYTQCWSQPRSSPSHTSKPSSGCTPSISGSKGQCILIVDRIPRILLGKCDTLCSAATPGPASYARQ